jgi:elongation factor G
VTSPPARFPTAPIRGIAARYARQSSGPGLYAAVTVDFEPHPGHLTGLDIEVADGLRLVGFGEHEGVPLAMLASFLEALSSGIQDELADHYPGPVAARVVLRHISIHQVDSSELAFRGAGRAAVRLALERA